ncbi:MAG: hypothetical protein MZV63_63270, partial [Marinilabiliales bacterium]|nr:hypothetical protein [Marinilabiliales bacterium]
LRIAKVKQTTTNGIDSTFGLFTEKAGTAPCSAWPPRPRSFLFIRNGSEAILIGPLVILPGEMDRPMGGSPLRFGHGRRPRTGDVRSGQGGEGQRLGGPGSRPTRSATSTGANRPCPPTSSAIAPRPGS